MAGVGPGGGGPGGGPGEVLGTACLILYGQLWQGVVLGLLSSAAGLAAAELVVGLVRGSVSPVVPVGQEVIDRVSPSVKDWAIDTFGTADKAVLVLGSLIVLAVIGSIVGILAVRGPPQRGLHRRLVHRADRRARRAATTGAVAREDGTGVGRHGGVDRDAVVVERATRHSRACWRTEPAMRPAARRRWVSRLNQ